MSESNGDKKHEPTPHRREEALKEGQVPKSQDLAAALVLLCAIIMLLIFGKEIAELFRKYSETMLREQVLLLPENDDYGLFNTVMSIWIKTIIDFMRPMGVFFGSLLLVAIIANFLQVGFLWLPNKLGFDITRLDPIKGFGRIFSTQSVIRLLLGICKVIVCGIVAFYAAYGEINTILDMTWKEDNQISSYMLYTLLIIALKVAIVLVILAIIDYIYQKWKHEQDLRMTDQEMREEIKQMIGDPQLVAKRRQIQREMAMKQRNIQGTTEADVVVSNPTHIAIAIKYDPLTMEVPFVVAKGTDLFAQLIRRTALQHGIPIVENKMLARLLNDTVEVGKPVYLEREEDYATLAKILAYAYRITGRTEEIKNAEARAAQKNRKRG
ncbi:MAG: EscU/YscU/HrcU family type III secretion system export apparatus switch protein [Planctomycetaceae bacterium]|jgi:flagellar biosynthetic protein FlhB|nr:EscU/YscU/HrcU family type III secretion system export apparatus switch protein [Planctomycetaceae bacterium]